MLKQNIVILVAGAALITAGLIEFQIWVVALRENTIVTNESKPFLIEPSKNVSKPFVVNSVDRNVSINLHIKSKFTNITNVTFAIEGPNGKVIDKNEIFHVQYIELMPSNITSEFVFKPDIVGVYKLHIFNKLSMRVSVEGIVGYTPFYVKGDKIDFSRGIVIGSFLITFGIITLIIGIVFAILKRFTSTSSTSIH